LLKEDADEAGSQGFFSGGFGLFGTLLKAVTIDGWVVIAVLAVMGVVTWIVMVTKFFYLRKIEKGTAEFVEEWSKVATDLTQLDREDGDGVKVLGEREGDDDENEADAMRMSPIYRVYHIGSEEISRRLRAGKKAIGPRAFHAIRASLDGGMARESQKLNAHMVFLTIAIAGGPFMGLLGTVIGVMITFAEIAASGEVNINAIAPGIAAALIATVAGLVVAIPALFGYNYLISKIKEVTVTGQVFIDEFVTKMAEFYPPTE
jgi:biopolymer transport protein ExbB